MRVSLEHGLGTKDMPNPPLLPKSSPCCDVALPFSPTFLRAVSVICIIHPSTHTHTHTHIPAPGILAIQRLPLHSAASQLVGETRHPVLAFTAGSTKRPETVHLKVRLLLVASPSDILAFNSGSWMQRLSNLQKVLKRERGGLKSETEEKRKNGIK